MEDKKLTASTFSFVLPEWFKSLDGVPTNLFGAASKDALGFAASHLEDPAACLKTLTRAVKPAEAWKCQFDFAQQSRSRSFSEAWRFSKNLRAGSWSASR